MTNNTKWILYGAAGFCVLLMLTIGSCAVGSLMGAGWSSQQDKTTDGGRWADAIAPARVENLPPITVRRFEVIRGFDGIMRYGIIIENNSGNNLQGVQYRTYSNQFGTYWNGWISLGTLLGNHHFTLHPSWQPGYNSGRPGLPDGLPIGPEDRVEIRVSGYDEMTSSW